MVSDLGVGSVFEVALVRDGIGRELIAKRPRAALGSPGRAAHQRELELLRCAATPHLPALVGAGSDSLGPYLLEGRADGQLLRDLLPDPTRPPVDRRTWMTIALATSAALSQLHAASDADGSLAIVHGDISPDNLLFDSAPRHATLIDLSSATWRDGRAPVFDADRGTLPYAAPELARGEAVAEQASDTYALAAVLLALAVGPICEATTAASRLLEIGSRGVMHERLRTRADLPVRARAALVRALSFEPRARLRTSAELAHEFLSET